MGKKKIFRLRYIIFITTVIVTIIANEVIVQYNINLQLSDAQIINKAGKQRMLSQRISKEVLYLQTKAKEKNNENLKDLINEWEAAHEFLSNGESGIENSEEIKLLFKKLQPHYEKMLSAAKTILQVNAGTAGEKAKNEILSSESHFLIIMDDIVLAYQKLAEYKLKRTKNIVLLLSCLSVLILLAEFVFIIIPFSNKLREQNKSLNQKNRRLSDFAHITSHNLRAPVSNLNSLFYLYDISEDEEQRKEVVIKLKTVVSHLNTTLETLINALKTQHGSSQKKEPIQLQEILTKTTDLLDVQLTESNAKVNSDFSRSPHINYNKLYVESIFLNLLSNSLKYKSPERNPEIHITSEPIKGKVVLTFSDNGLGIDLKRHGDKLFGLSKTFHRHPEARGIGLFMTRTQIESLGGTITADSTVNEGITFTITL